MHTNWMKRAAAALLAAMSLTAPAAAAQVEVNGTPLEQSDGWLEGGSSYVTLKALCRETEYSLDWDGTTAYLSGRDVQLAAQPGACYVEVNGRALYVPGGVRTVEGRTVLPLRLLEEALGGLVCWDSESKIASLDVQQASAKQADYPEEDLYWLARIMLGRESGGTSAGADWPWATWCSSRVKSKQYPNTIKDGGLRPEQWGASSSRSPTAPFT